MAKSSIGIILHLSWKDLLHEWILTLCQIMAVAAVLAPLLLLFGLKYGVIKASRDILIQDPRYREIRPMISKTFGRDWFGEMKVRPDVASIIPNTRRISATIDAAVGDVGKRIKLDVVPTDTGDPLLLENGAPIPGPDECVLTAYAAEALGAKISDTLHTRVSRSINGRLEYGKRNVTVVGILSPRATTLKSAYFPLTFLEALEDYKDGSAVPKFGWKGSSREAYPLYDGAIVIVPQPLSQVESLRLCSKTGFTKIETVEPVDLINQARYQVDNDVFIYRLFTLSKAVGNESFVNVRGKLRGKKAVIIPWIKPISAELSIPGVEESQVVKLQVLSGNMQEAGQIGFNPSPFWESSGRHTDILKIMLSPSVSPPDKTVFLHIVSDHGELFFPVRTVAIPSLQRSSALIPAQLGGILKQHQIRKIEYNDSEKRFTLSRRGYAGFRLYANSIDTVDGLRKYFEEDGLTVSTEMIAINKVKNLDKGMTLIFWLLALVGLTGSTASLTASLYASVVRKKKEIGVLRLMGVSGTTLFLFPLYQGVLIGISGYFFSMGLFLLFSKLINQWFSPYLENMIGFDLDQGVHFCKLSTEYAAMILLGTVTIALIAAIIAAIRVTKIEPSEALRDE